MDVRFHLPVLSECDAGCKLCGPLQCLRPTRLTFPEFVRELDAALLSCAKTVVFPPNFLNHPEAGQFCAEVSRKGLTPLVRLRPSQLSPNSHLLAELEFRGAKFEVCIIEPLTQFEMPIEFKPVFIPSRAYDPALLFDSLPFAWRNKIEIFADPSLIGADALALFMSERNIRPYADTTRAIPGYIPGARSRELTFGKRSDETRISVIVKDVTVATLEALKSQSLESAFYEVVAVNGVNDDDVIAWCSSQSLAVTLIERPERWGLHQRLSESFAIGALAARGTRFVFVEPEFPLERDFLMRSAVWTEPLVKIESRSAEAPVRCALMMSAVAYFAQGGFSLAHDGFTFEFALWKTPGPLWVLGDVDKEGLVAIAPRFSVERARSATDLYFATLDANVYARHFDLLGSRPRLRRLMRFVMSLTATRALITVVTSLIHHLKAAHLQGLLQKARA